MKARSAVTQGDFRCDYFYAGEGQRTAMDPAAIVLYDSGRAGGGRGDRLVVMGDGEVKRFKAKSPELAAVIEAANALRQGDSRLPDDLMAPPQ